jgi:thiol-disulfide isomerase/thioredoxin
MACCLALTGCSLFGRKSAGTGGAAPAPAPPPRTDQPPIAARPLEPAGGGNGLLAGEIIDSFNRRPSGAYIQVSLVREGSEPAAAPIEVAADPQGYFTIQGLQVGRHYQLVARSQDSEHKLAGMAWATPPNPRLLIRLREDNGSPSIPAVPAAPWPATRPTPPAPVWPDDKGENGAASGWSPSGPAHLGAPVKTNDVAPAARERPARPDLVLNVNPQVPRLTPSPQPIDDTPTPPFPTPPAPPPPAAPIPVVPAPVPSCVLTGQTLVNFALNDLNGRPWEYRQHPSRLTLIDFWGTWCFPCRNAIPHLKILQDTYGNFGLTVVGIAYEKEGTVAEQVQKVNGVRLRYAMNYQVLLGDMRSCPVRTQFDVRSFPTLVLIDETGRIIWRAQGLDPQRLSDLEALIRQRVGIR